MNVVRFEPFSAVDDFVNRMMPAMLARMPRMAVPADDGTGLQWAPSADISETDKEYLIRAELPAVRKEDVKVTLNQGMLTIEGERRQVKEDTSEKYHRKESVYGSFMRSWSIPENANQDAIRCESKDGVLTVHIPKSTADAPKSKTIKVD